ncbi:MAG: radical SAM family heme chaperone HemW [Bacteroidota bacterium]
MAGLYLHIPFCTQRCVYCDFYFVTTRRSYTSFVQAMCHEIEAYAHTYAALEPVDTIYLGGGTPSLLHTDEIYRLLNAVHDHFDTSQVQEVTLELNPEDADVDTLRAYRGMGIDRLSIGIQSFFAEDLAFMNRSHTPEEAEAIIPLARQAGFDNFSVDLIFGLPDQPLEYWGANLQKVIRLEVPHLSAYNLEVMEHTVLWKRVQRGLVTPTGDEAMLDRYRLALDLLRAGGYEQYEISSFCRDGQRALHNQNYWRHKNYLGFGPSAHSLWWKGLPAKRWSNMRNLRIYETLLAQHDRPVDEELHLLLDELAEEYILLSLRTAEGINLAWLNRNYGVDLLYEKADEVEALIDQGYVASPTDGHIRLTDEGKLVCDAVTARLALD